MRVLHIISGLEDGGAEGVLFRLCVLDTNNEHIVISLMGDGKYGPLLDTQGIPVKCLRWPRGRMTISGLAELWREVRLCRPDVVQTWMYHADLVGGLVARFAGSRYVVWGVRNSTLRIGRSRASTIAIARLNALLSYFVPASVVCCAERALHVHQSLGYSIRRMVVIENGFDLDEVAFDAAARERLRAQWNVPNDIPIIGMVARYDPQKDHESLLRALGHLNRRGLSFVAILVGRGVDTGNAKLRAAVSREGLSERVLQLGQTVDIPAVMSAFDIHVLSSAYGEAFPNVLAEAMACQTPCVTTDVGDAAAIVGKTGWVVPAGSYMALSAAIEEAVRAFRDDDSWAIRRLEARMRIVERYEARKMIRKYVETWNLVRKNGLPKSSV